MRLQDDARPTTSLLFVEGVGSNHLPHTVAVLLSVVGAGTNHWAILGQTFTERYLTPLPPVTRSQAAMAVGQLDSAAEGKGTRGDDDEGDDEEGDEEGAVLGREWGFSGNSPRQAATTPSSSSSSASSSSSRGRLPPPSAIPFRTWSTTSSLIASSAGTLLGAVAVSGLVYYCLFRRAHKNADVVARLKSGIATGAKDCADGLKEAASAAREAAEALGRKGEEPLVASTTHGTHGGGGGASGDTMTATSLRVWATATVAGAVASVASALTKAGEAVDAWRRR